ncbi:hypothetical protein ETH_00039435, partial [Eimeria tenella]
FIANRGEFDVEFDEDAEALVADLEFNPQDTPQETALKSSTTAASMSGSTEEELCCCGAGQTQDKTTEK